MLKPVFATLYALPHAIRIYINGFCLSIAFEFIVLPFVKEQIHSNKNRICFAINSFKCSDSKLTYFRTLKLLWDH